MDDDLLFVERLDDRRSLCVSHLSQRALNEEGVQNLGDSNGYFIYEIDDGALVEGVSVLAKAVSLDAVFRLIDLWRGRYGDCSTVGGNSEAPY